MKNVCLRITIVLLLISCLSLSGCWDQIELDQIALVLLMGIDTNPMGDGFEVTVQVLNTAGGGASQGQQGGGSNTGSGQTVTITAQGQTIMDATRNLRGQLQGQFSFHHVRVLLVGEDLARKGIDPILDFLLRAPEIRMTNRLLICQGSARDIMALAPKSAQTLDEELRGIINNQDTWGKAYVPRLTDFVSDFLDRSAQPVAGRLSIEFLPIPLQPDGQQQTQSETVLMEGLAVFRDGQLVEWLSGTETMGYRYITGEGGTLLLVVPWHASKAVFEITQDYHSVEYVAGSSPPQFRVTMQTSAILVEYTGHIELTNQKLKELRALTADTLKELLINTEKKAKDINIDFLGYGSAISRQAPNDWESLHKEWRETFPAIRTQFSVHLDFRNSGPIQSPPIP